MADLPTKPEIRPAYETTPTKPVPPGPMSHEAERHHFAQANARWSNWLDQPKNTVWADWLAKPENEPLATWLKDHPDDVPEAEQKAPIMPLGLKAEPKPTAPPPKPTPGSE